MFLRIFRFFFGILPVSYYLLQKPLYIIQCAGAGITACRVHSASTSGRHCLFWVSTFHHPDQLLNGFLLSEVIWSRLVPESILLYSCIDYHTTLHDGHSYRQFYYIIYIFTWCFG